MTAGSLYHADKVVADRLLAASGILRFPARPALLAGCEHGRIWIDNGIGGRDWPSNGQAKETFTRHCIAVLDAVRAREPDAEAYHRRFEDDLRAAFDARDEYRGQGPLFGAVA